MKNIEHRTCCELKKINLLYLEYECCIEKMPIKPICRICVRKCTVNKMWPFRY